MAYRHHSEGSSATATWYITLITYRARLHSPRRLQIQRLQLPAQPRTIAHSTRAQPLAHRDPQLAQSVRDIGGPRQLDRHGDVASRIVGHPLPQSRRQQQRSAGAPRPPVAIETEHRHTLPERLGGGGSAVIRKWIQRHVDPPI